VYPWRVGFISKDYWLLWLKLTAGPKQQIREESCEVPQKCLPQWINSLCSNESQNNIRRKGLGHDLPLVRLVQSLILCEFKPVTCYKIPKQNYFHNFQMHMLRKILIQGFILFKKTCLWLRHKDSCL
jgi:hypothetical protein